MATLRTALWTTAAAAGLAALAGSARAGEEALGAPRLLRSGDAPIRVLIGHAAPCVTDFDGDGVPDLLVGQFGDGKLLVFRNTGSATDPVLGAAVEFQAGGKAGTVPSG
jgi:hypothetical protein